MVDQSSDSGYELVLDNRRLIVAFAVLILIFGCFFVLGFMEGKRQGFQAGSQAAAEVAANQVPVNEPRASEISPPKLPAGTDSANAQPEERPLEWYKNVSGKGAKPGITPSLEPSRPAPKTLASKPPALPVAKSTVKAAPSTPASYSVQVGAFRQQKQVEAKAELLRSKGFDCRIEPPESDEGLFLLKVGRFNSRAEAVAMQLRLKNSGFSCFIKTN